MTKKVVVLVIGLLVSFLTTQAQWTQINSDIDGEAGDRSGFSISLSSGEVNGTQIAIGAPGNDENGEDAGRVRIYEAMSGTWMQIGSDIYGETADDNFGYSVSLSSDALELAIGAPYSNNERGYVSIYSNVMGTWEQLGSNIEGEAGGDRSGKSISISSDGLVVAIGAENSHDNGTLAGHVRIYEQIGGIWTQIGSDLDGSEYEKFGSSVSLSSDGSVVAIGAKATDGYAYRDYACVYENIEGTWTQIGSNIESETIGDNFGCSVSLSSDGSIIAIGGKKNNENGEYAGHVRIYENISGTWTQIGNDIDGETEGDWFGSSVSLNSNGSIVAIGAPYNAVNGMDAGSVSIYENISGTWTQKGSNIYGEAEGDMSGNSTSLTSDGLIVAIGASQNNGNGEYAGHTRLYEYDNVGVSDLSENGISIYPNPTNGILNFEFANNNIQNLSISDITGRTIQNFTNSQVQNLPTIDLSNLENGIYIIKIQTDNEIFTTKIVKE